MGDDMRSFYNDNVENFFDVEMQELAAKTEVLKKKAENVFNNVDKISIFRVFMSINRVLNIDVSEIKVRHNRVFNTDCHYHNAMDNPFDIYDNMGYCRCYGCGKTSTVVELICNFIDLYLTDESKKEMFDNSTLDLAIEVVDAFLNGVKPAFYTDGKFIGFDKPEGYKFANKESLVTSVLGKAFEYYDSEDINKYIEESDKKTAAHDERISNYINIYGIDVSKKFADKLCLSEGYINYRLKRHFLFDKLNMNRIIELAMRDGLTPLELEEKKNLITFYENDDKVMKANIIILTNLFHQLEESSKDWSVIQNVKIDPEQNKFSFSIALSDGTTLDYEINVEKAKSIKEIAYSSVYKKERANSKSNVLSIIGGDYDLSKFPTKAEYTIIQALESSGVEVLFANNEFTYDQKNSPYILNNRPVKEDAQPEICYFWYTNRYKNSIDESLDENLERFFAHSLVSINDNIAIKMLGEIIFKITLPDAWREYYNNWQEEIKKQKAKKKDEVQN